MQFQEPLNDFEARLKKIALSAPSLNRDRLMYRCGQASQQAAPMPKSHTYWQLASASCLAFLFGAGLMFWNQQNDLRFTQNRQLLPERSTKADGENESTLRLGWSEEQLSTLRSRSALRISSRFEDLAQGPETTPLNQTQPIDIPASPSRLIDLYRRFEDPSTLRDN